MHRLVAAVAHAYAYMRGGVYYIRSALVVKDMQRVFVGNLRLLREYPSHLYVSAADQIAHEILFHRYVLVEKLGKSLLIYIMAHPHQRELEEACHRRRHGVDLAALLLDIDEYRAGGKFVQIFLRFGLAHLPDARCLMHVKWLYRQLGHQPGFFFRHQVLQYVVQQF